MFKQEALKIINKKASRYQSPIQLCDLSNNLICIQPQERYEKSYSILPHPPTQVDTNAEEAGPRVNCIRPIIQWKRGPLYVFKVFCITVIKYFMI